MSALYKVISPVKPEKKTYRIIKFNNVLSGIEENNMELYYSPNCYNVDVSTGAVKPCFGFENAKYSIRHPNNNKLYEYEFPIDEMFFCTNGWVYRRIDYTTGLRDDRLVIVDVLGNLYQKKLYSDEGLVNTGKFNDNTINIEGLNYCYNGDDVMLFSTGDEKLYILNDATLTHIDNVPKLSSLCIHNERVFATISGEKNAVWFSEDFNPANWNVSLDEGGFIEFRDEGGSVNKVVSFLDYVYIFRDFSIHKLSAYGAQEDFILSRVYLNAGRIYPQTIAVCGDFIIFLTDSGLFKFNGYDISPLLTDIKELFDKGKYMVNNVACYHNGNYYLSTNFTLPGESYSYMGYLIPELSSVLSYNVFDNDFTITRGVDVRRFMPVELDNMNLLFALANHDDQSRYKVVVRCDENKYYDHILEKKWSTPYTDLGKPENIKRISSFLISGKGNITVTVNMDGQTKEMEITLIEGKPFSMKMNNKFSKISFTFTSRDNDFKIINFMMKVYFYEVSENG